MQVIESEADVLKGGTGGLKKGGTEGLKKGGTEGLKKGGTEGLKKTTRFKLKQPRVLLKKKAIAMLALCID